MKKKSTLAFSSLLFFSFLLAGCSFLQKEDLHVNTGVLDDMSIDSWDVLLSWDQINTWKQLKDTVILDDEKVDKGQEISPEENAKMENDIKSLIEKRKAELWTGDNLTEKDIDLIEEILNKLMDTKAN